MSEAAAALPPGVEEQLAALGPCDLAVGVLTYNNAVTVPTVAAVARDGCAKHFAGARAALVNADAGSSDGTPDLLAEAGLPVIRLRHEAPLAERVAVPYHGVPGREAALRLTLAVARRLAVRALVVLEADVTSATAEWVERLGRLPWEGQADLVVPAYARHRYDGTITNLLVAPLVRALFGRRLRQPVTGAAGLSARLVAHLLDHPGWPVRARDGLEAWMVGAATVAGFALAEAWLGPLRVESRTRATDLPAMVAQAVGGVFALMDRAEELWLEVRGSEAVPAVGQPQAPSAEPAAVDVERMVDAFGRGLRDLTSIWESVLAPETLGEVLSLDAPEPRRFRFPDDLWARVVYDFALGHHWGVVHRDHLLRSLVPLYLGRTAAFVLATREADPLAVVAQLEAVGQAFERRKPYLVERWR